MRLPATFLASSRTAPKQLHEHSPSLTSVQGQKAAPQNVNQLTIDIIGYILSQMPSEPVDEAMRGRRQSRKTRVSANGLCVDARCSDPTALTHLLGTRIYGDLAMNVGHFEQISDCWSLEGQPATYYRTAAARARTLQADATTPGVRQYLDNMIAHCELLAGNVEPASHPAPTDDTRGGRGWRDRDRLQPRLRRTR